MKSQPIAERLSRRCVFALIACGAVTVTASAAAARGAAPARVDGNKTIARNMKAIDASVRELGSLLVEDDKSKECLKLLLDVQKKLMTVKRLRPGVVSEASRDERDALQKEFRILINNALREVIEAENEYLKGDGEAAAKRIQGPLSEAIKAGHAKFRPKKP